MCAMLAVVWMFTAGVSQAAGQACGGQNWAGSTANIWAATVSDTVMLNNDPATNKPTIPTMLYDGTYSPWGYSQRPQPITQLNTNWSCPSGSPVISIAGSGRETVAFQIFITAPAATSLTSVSVGITSLTGPGTLTSDNTGTSNVTRYLEGYVPYSCTGAQAIGCVQASGSIPDPLIPFYDPYDSGNPAVATPFNVQQGTTQGVWVDISIPANQAAGTYNGTVTVSGNGIGTQTIPLKVTVWSGNLPAFDAGSINSSYADMLKVWLPFYENNLDQGEGVSGTDIPIFQKYQVMAHNYDIDMQFDPIAPAINGSYPSPNPTSFTTNGTTSTIDWTAYDAMFGASLTPGGLFADGTAMRVLDSPIANGGAGAWTYPPGYSWCMYNCGNAPLMPAGLVSLTQNYATQISQHFSANHSSKGWAVPDLLSYTFDENYNVHSYQLGDQPLVYQIISQVDQAINASNSSLSSTWAASTAPIRTLMTDEPACMESGDTTYYTNAACADHLNLSYPGGAQATAGYTTSWVTAWSPNPSIYMTGQPGPGLSYGVDPTIIAGTGYQYTLDLTQGVPALSTAPAPIERWSYNNGGGGSGGMGRRATYWEAYKYGQDETIASVGDPNPAAPSPGGLWSWIGNFWGGYNGTANASTCNSLSPYTQNGSDQGDSYFFPGNELGCYYTANPVGQTVLTASPAVNTSCTSNGFSVCNGISGPVATRELEQWRRGYEDYEYLYLYGKQAGRAAAEAVVASIAAEGMSDWEGYDWENIDGAWYEYGVTPVGTAYSGNCTYSSPINSPIFGNLANGLPYGPTGQGSSGSALNYNGCEPLYSPDPATYEAARLKLAQALGFAPATTPSVTSLSPSSGLNTGGTSVQITGTNFTGATAVQFGGVAAASFSVNSSTSITAVTPAGNGTVAVQVFGPAGGSEPSSGDLYTYVSPVTVTGLSPSQGVAVGGNSVNITGTYFAAGATVLFGTKAATNVVVNSASSITATAPSGSNQVYVTVTTSQGTSATGSANLYTYEAPPAVTSVSPNSGPIAGGTSVTLGGSGFVTGMTVDFGSNAATGVTVNSSSSATVTSPAGSSNSGGVVDVTVSTTNGTSTINGGDQFTYTSPVTVTALSVHTGPPAGGTQVIITGTDFTGATAVKFGGNPASYTVNSSTQITATSPAGGGTVDVTVTTSPYSSSPARADQFSYSSAVANGTFATLPTTNVGSASSSQNVSVTLQSATAISSITVPKAQNGVQEFTVGTVSGCSIGGTVNAANTVCTVPITFHPQYPGVRMGALDINNAGTVVGTAGLAGIGQGPQVEVMPGALAMAIGGGVSGVTATPQSVTTAALSVSNNGSATAMDGAGNLYIADDINCMAYKVTAATNQIVAIAGNYNFSSGAVTPSTTPEPALGSNTCPQGIAVDGAGNVYIIDVNTNDGSYPNEVEEVSAATGQIFVMAGGGAAAPSTTPQAATSVALDAVNSLATDTAGNLYIADFYHNLVEKVTPAGQLAIFAGGGSTPVSTTPQPATSAQLNGPTGMVMDASGNFFISDQNIGVIERVNSSGQIVSVAGGGGNPPSTTPQTALSVAISNPAGLAVDGAGDLYIADYSNQVVDQVNLAGQLVVVAGSGGTVPTATSESSTSAQLGLIEGVEVDGAGNIYIADGQNIGGGDNMVEKVSAAGQPLSFPFTNVGSTSVPQSIKLANIGNQSLTLSSLSATTDFPLQSGGTCALTPTSGQSLAVSTTCSLSYAFHPTTGGVLNESATLTDNNLNVSGAHQGIALTGTGVGGTNPQLTSINPPSGGNGTSVTVTGTNLSGATTMTFGATPVTPSSSTSTTVTATAPSGSGTVNVTVTTSNGTSNAESFTYTSTPAATPTFSPAAGTYTSTQTVTISDSTSGATIYYTTNGTTPTTSSTVYSAPISVSTTETVEAIATASGYTTSPVGSAAYTITVNSLPSGWSDSDIGSPAIAGSGNYSGSTYTVKGGGADIWGTSDQFNYAETAPNGDVTITARVVSQQNTNGWAKSGVMIRDTAAADSAYVYVYVTPGEGDGLQYRASTGAEAAYPAGGGGQVAPYWVRLVRSGSTFTGSISPDGTTWTSLGSVTATIGTNALVGLAVTAHDNSQLNTSTFDNVSITATIPPQTVNYPLTDAFSGSGALSTSWTNTTETSDFNGTLVQSGGQAVPSTTGTVGLATYTGATFTNDQLSQTTYLANSPTGNNNTGPCVRTDTNGDGYCYFPQNGQVWSMKQGATVVNGVPGTVIIHWQTCPVATSGDTVQISAVGTTITCKDVTTGGSASVVDSSITTGNPGIMIDQRGPSGYGLGSFQADCVPSCGSSAGDVVAINSGGSASGSFAADEDASGGGAATYANTIDTSAVANPAPVAVYQTERYGVATYTIPGLTSGKNYIVRLHFAEIYWTQAGQRIFNVSINGTAVLSNFDIIATAGAANKAIVETFAATANSSGQIVIALTNGSADQGKISGIEVQ